MLGLFSTFVFVFVIVIVFVFVFVFLFVITVFFTDEQTNRRTKALEEVLADLKINLSCEAKTR